MGGSGDRNSGGGGGGGGGGSGGGGSGEGGGGGADDGCPPMLRARLPHSNAPNIHVGEAVTAQLGGTLPETVVIATTSEPIGMLAGIPDLAQLIRCLAKGVRYLGLVDKIANGAVEVVLWRK